MGWILTDLIGTLAAGLHTVLGDVAAASVFAILQSAGAGGAGVVVVNGVVRAVALVSGVWTFLKKEASNMGRGDDPEEIDLETPVESTAATPNGTDTARKPQDRTVKPSYVSSGSGSGSNDET